MHEDVYDFLNYKNWLTKFLQDDKRDYINYLFPLRNFQFEVDFINAVITKEIFNHYFKVFPFKFIVSKSPGYAKKIVKLFLAFPQAKYIHMVRHPLDYCVSRAFHEWNLYRSKKECLSILDKDHLKKLDKSIRNNLKLFRDKIILDIFINDYLNHNYYVYKLLTENNQFYDKILIVKYEDLISNFEFTLKKIFNFLNLVPDFDMNFYKEYSSFKKLSGRERGMEDKTSFYRKGIVGDYLNYMDSKDILYVKSIKKLNDLLKFFGYII